MDKQNVGGINYDGFGNDNIAHDTTLTNLDIIQMENNDIKITEKLRMLPPIGTDSIFTGPKYIKLYDDGLSDNHHKRSDGIKPCFELDEKNEIGNGEMMLRVVEWEKSDIPFYTVKKQTEFVDDMSYLHLKGKHINASEIIFSYMKQKPRLDIDNATVELAKSIYDKFKNALVEIYDLDKEAYPCGACVDTYDSSNDKKISRHLVARELCWSTNSEAKYFINKFKLMLTDEEEKCCDWKIYSKTAGLRTIYSTKTDKCPVTKKELGKRQKKLLTAGEDTETSSEWTVIDSLITYVKNCVELPKLSVTEGSKRDNVDFIPQVINEKYKNMITTFAEKNGFIISAEKNGGSKINLSRAKSAMCPVCSRAHDRIGGFVVSRKYKILFYCYGAISNGLGKKCSEIFAIERPTIYSNPVQFKHKFSDIYKIESMRDVCKVLPNSLAYVSNNSDPFFVVRTINKHGDVKFILRETKNFSKELKTWTQDDTVAKKQKNMKLMDIISQIVNSKRMTIYSCAGFMPDKQGQHGDTFNFFSGFKHIKGDYNIKNIEPILEHIHEVWCKNVQTSTDYIIKLFAHIVQKPAVKTNTAVVIKGVAGCGKSSIIEFFGRKVIGGSYYNYCSNVMEIFDKFNEDFMHTLVTLVDETETDVKSAGAIRTELKSKITRLEFKVEEKMKPKIPGISDYNNYFFMSNEDLPLYIERDDRRMFILDCDKKYKGNNKYFARLRESMAIGGYDFYNYLMSQDLSGFEPDVRPVTDAKDYMIEQSLPLHMKYLVDFARLNSDKQEFNETVDETYNSFLGWCANSGVRNVPSKLTFGRELNIILPTDVKKVKGVAIRYRKMTMDELREKIREYSHARINLFENIKKDENIKNDENIKVEEVNTNNS